MNTYRHRERPNQNENFTHQIQILTNLCYKGNTYSTTANGWQKIDCFKSTTWQTVEAPLDILLKKKFLLSLHAALVNEDVRCTPLDLVHANSNELPMDEEHNSKDKSQCSRKALRGHHLYGLSQQYVDIEASDKGWQMRIGSRKQRAF